MPAFVHGARPGLLLEEADALEQTLRLPWGFRWMRKLWKKDTSATPQKNLREWLEGKPEHVCAKWGARLHDGRCECGYWDQMLSRRCASWSKEFDPREICNRTGMCLIWHKECKCVEHEDAVGEESPRNAPASKDINVHAVDFCSHLFDDIRKQTGRLQKPWHNDELATTTTEKVRSILNRMNKTSERYCMAAVAGSMNSDKAAGELVEQRVANADVSSDDSLASKVKVASPRLEKIDELDGHVGS